MLRRLIKSGVTAAASAALVLGGEEVPYAARRWRPALAAWATPLLGTSPNADHLVHDLRAHFRDHVSAFLPAHLVVQTSNFSIHVRSLHAALRQAVVPAYLQWAGATPPLPAAGTIEVGWTPAARSALHPEQQQAVEAAAPRALALSVLHYSLAAVLEEVEARGYGDHMAVSAGAACHSRATGCQPPG